MLDRSLTHLPVFIAGSGLVGSLMALSLARLNIPVKLMNPVSLANQMKQPTDGRAISLTHSSRLLFEQQGVWNDLSAFVQPLSTIYTTDATGTRLELKADDLPHKALGYMIDSKRLKDTLLKAIQNEPRIKYIQDAVDHLSYLAPFNHAIQVTGKSGATYKCALLIGADGGKSKVRQLLNLRVHQWSYDQTAFVRVYKHSNPHLGVAYEKFLNTGPFAILPMQGNQSSIVWTVNAEKAAELNSLSEQYFDREAFTHMSEYTHLSPKSPLWRFNIQGCWAPHFTTARAALIGDAAHVIHPLAGQGFNLGILDVGVLTTVIQKGLSLGLDVGSAALLQTYQRQQRMKHLSLLGATDSLNRLFSNEDTTLSWIRKTGLDFGNKMPALKSFFIEKGTGSVARDPHKLNTTKSIN